MKILVVCRRGQVRSKCLAKVLSDKHETRYRGASFCGNQLTKEDIEWADIVFFFENWMYNLFDSYREKTVFLGNIPDIFVDAENPQLIKFCNGLRKFLNRYGVE